MINYVCMYVKLLAYANEPAAIEVFKPQITPNAQIY